MAAARNQKYVDRRFYWYDVAGREMGAFVSCVAAARSGSCAGKQMNSKGLILMALRFPLFIILIFSFTTEKHYNKKFCLKKCLFYTSTLDQIYKHKFENYENVLKRTTVPLYIIQDLYEIQLFIIKNKV